MTPIIRKRRAISPAITTLILLGIAVASGVSVYGVANSASNVATIQGVVTIENVSLVKTTLGEEYLSMTLKNSGNKALSSTTVNLQVDTNAVTAGLQPFTVTPIPAALKPGQTTSVYSRVNNSGGTAMTSENLGDTIAIEVVGTTIDGSTVRQTATVAVSVS
jgi:hypothetical protein